MNTKLPYMVATVGELVDPLEEESKDGSGMSNQTSKLKGKALEEAKANAKAVVVKTTSRQSFYLPNTGLL